jgi:hypothetical protein
LKADGQYPLVDAPVFGLTSAVVPTNALLPLTAPSGGTIYYTLDGSDPRNPADNLASGNAVLYTNAFPLAQTGDVRARVLDGGNWSALDERFYIVGTPASSNTLVVSELMYHPLGLNPEHEFIEVENRSNEPLDLTNVRFTSGIFFAFPDGFELGVGERVVVVDDPVAYTNQYGSGARVAGTYTDKLDDGGERIILLAEDDSEISNFRYNDKWPWPEAPDGTGYSLVYISGDPALPENWRSSAMTNGTPGGTDGLAYAGGDALVYAFGAGPELRVDASGSEFGYSQIIAADAVRVVPEWSIDLIQWDSQRLMGLTDTPDGNGRVQWSWLVPDGQKGYVRLRVELR